MEILLTKNFESLGEKNDIVTVKNGYARNYLIPKGIAILATESVKKMQAETLKQRAHKEAKLKEECSVLHRNIDIKLDKNKRDIQNLLAEFKNSVSLNIKR